MKNIIPLVVAVILGLAAVYIVSNLIFDNDNNSSEAMVSVVIASRDLDTNDELRQENLSYKDIPASAIPQNALLWENVGLAIGQQLLHNVSKNDYVLTTAIRLQATLSDSCRQGEWTIPVTFSDPALVQMLIPDDEIAILATYVSQKVVMAENPDLTTMPVDVEQSRETIVLLPCVRVIGIANSDGSFREGGSSSGTIFVSLPPQQAMILVAAQREAELYPVLRKDADSYALSRKDCGVVNGETFSTIKADLTPVELPEVPNKNYK